MNTIFFTLNSSINHKPAIFMPYLKQDLKSILRILSLLQRILELQPFKFEMCISMSIQKKGGDT